MGYDHDHCHDDRRPEHTHDEPLSAAEIRRESPEDAAIRRASYQDAYPDAAGGPAPRLTAGAEAANVIPISCQLQDRAGQDVPKTSKVQVTLFDAKMKPSVAAAYTLAIGGAGTLLSATGQSSVLAETDAAGRLDLTVRDVAGASNATIFAFVDVLDGTKDFTPLTFDAS